MSSGIICLQFLLRTLYLLCSSIYIKEALEMLTEDNEDAIDSEFWFEAVINDSSCFDQCLFTRSTYFIFS